METRALAGFLTLDRTAVDALLHGTLIPIKVSAVRRVQKTPDDRHLIKEYRPRTLADRVRRRAGHSPARQEATTLAWLAERGLPVPRPLAWRRDARADHLILEFCANAGTLQDLAERAQLDGEQRLALGRTIGQTLARMHAAGVWHRDCHAGNVLVTPDHRGVLLLDFHRARRRSGAVPRTQADLDLIGFGHFFLARSTLRERVAFLRAYAAHGTIAPRERKRWMRMLSVRSIAALRILLRRKERRCVSEGREFRPLQGDGRHGWARVSEDSDRLLGWLADATLPRGGRVLLATVNSRVVRVVIDGRDYVVKTFADHGVRGLVKWLVRGPRARRAWQNQHRFRLRDLPTPRGLVYLAGSIMHRDSLLAMEYVPGESLRAFLARASAGTRERHHALRTLARDLRRMHDGFLRNRDLKAENILVASGAAVLVDLDGVRPTRGLVLRIVARDLMRLNASFPTATTVHDSMPSARVSLKERLRFLRWYCHAGWCRLPEQPLREAIAALTQRKWSRATIATRR